MSLTSGVWFLSDYSHSSHLIMSLFLPSIHEEDKVLAENCMWWDCAEHLHIISYLVEQSSQKQWDRNDESCEEADCRV